MRLSQVFRQKECVFSIEVFPPKKNGATPESLYPTLEKLAGLSPDYISVTYGAGGGKAGLSTVQIARHLKQELGVEPLAHLTGINSTREQVAETVQALQEAGIENVLTLRGDICPDAPRSKDFFHASDLATFVKGKGDFYLAGACYPEGHVESETLRQDVENLKYKLDAGVEHLVTQLFFDNARYYRFMNLVRKAGIQAPVQAGVMPIVSARQVQRTVALSSASLPPRFTKMISRYDGDDAALFDAGIDYAIEQLRDLIEGGADGVHLYAMNNPEVARRVYEGIRDLLPEAKALVRQLPPALDRAEALRYLGGAGKEVPPAVDALLDKAAAELWRTAAPRAAVRRVSADKLAPLLTGRDIAAHLKGCDEGLLLAVTLGAGVDSALRRAMATDMAYGVVLDAAASTLVEQLADALEAEQRALLESEGRYLTGRFSPGYGDWPITVQPAFVQWLDAGRQAGICSTASCVLTPGKSITALCGAADHPVKGKLAGCATCALREICTKRKEGKPCAQ